MIRSISMRRRHRRRRRRGARARVCVCVCALGSISTLRIADGAGVTTDDVCVRACVSLTQARTVSLVTVDMAKRTKKVGT
jgi:hypothetical protein